MTPTPTGSSLAVVESDSVVVSMKRASMALAEAVTISQTKKIMDVAAAAEIYAKRQHLSEEAEQMAATVKVEALRKLGEMLRVAPKAKARFDGTKSVPSRNEAKTLAEVGLTKKESAVAQKLAALPEKSFQQVRDGHITVAKAIAAIDATKKAGKGKPAAKTGSKTAEPEDYSKTDLEIDNLRGALDAVSEENDGLKQRVAVECMDATEEEKLAANDLITELRKQVKSLTLELHATQSVRNQLMTTNAELVKTVAYWKRQAAKAEKAAA